MRRIEHDGTLTSEDWLDEIARQGIRRSLRRENLMMKFGCTGLVVGGLSVATLAVGGGMFVVGSLTADSEMVVRGKAAMEVGVGGVVASGVLFNISSRYSSNRY